MKRKIIPICQFLLLPLCAAAQPQPQCRVINYNTDNGLPQNSVYSVQFDKMGNLWIGTQGGVVCFNGYSFKTLFSEMPSQRIGHLLRDKDDSIWVMDNSGDAFQVIPAKADLKKVKGSQAGFDTYWKKAGVQRTHEEIDRALYPLLTSDRYNLFYYYDNNLKEVVCLNTGKRFGRFEKPARILACGDTLLVIHPGGKQTAVLPQGLQMSITQTLAPFSPAALNTFFSKAWWFSEAGYSYGLLGDKLYSVSFNGTQLVIRLLLTGLPAIREPVSCAFNPVTHTYVISSNLDGLYVLQPSPFFNLVKSLRSGSAIQVSNSITGIAELQNGDLLDNTGVRYPKDGLAVPVVVIPDISPLSFLQDRQGDIWYMRESDGRVDRRKSDLTLTASFSLPFRWPEVANCFNEGKEDDFFIGTLRGIYRFTRKGRLDTLYRLSEKEQHTGRWIERIYQHTKDTLLLLTKEGLYALSLHTGIKKMINGSAGLNFRLAFLSQTGNLWLGTYGNGIFLYRNGGLTAIPVDSRGDLKNANALLEDGKGFFWVSTNNGLFRLREQDLLSAAANGSRTCYYEYYDKSFGYRSNEFNGGPNIPAIKTRNNAFCFVSLEGIIGFYPASVVSEMPDAPISFGKVTADTLLLDTESGSVRLKHDFNHLSVEINTSYFGHRTNLQLEYRLGGGDSSWHVFGNSRPLQFTRLVPGRYELEIRKKAGFGPQNYIYKKLAIEVVPPFYQTGWFYAALLVLAVALIFLFVRIRTSRLLKQERRLKELVEEKTADLKETNLSLQNQIHQNELMMSVLSHDIRGPLKYLNDTLDILEERWTSFDDQKKISITGQARKGSQAVYQFTGNFLTWLQLQKTQSTVLQEVLLKEVTRQILHFTEQDALQIGDVKLINQVNETIRVYTNPQLLLIILNNIVDNAVKYTRQGEIVLEAMSVKPGWVDISCRDTGSGMTPDKAAMLMQQKSAFSVNTHELINDSFRLGYLFIQEALPLIRGTLQIVSAPGKGTTVVIRVPAEQSGS